MYKLGALGALFAMVQIALCVAAVAASGASPLSALSGAGALGPDRAVVFVGGMGGGGGGMGGGGSGGMGSSGGMGGGGIGGGGIGGMGGGGMGGWMGGGHFGSDDLFGNSGQSFGRPAEDQPANSAPLGYYTYQCITPAGRCPFVAPASLRENSLRSGADCVCADGQSKGRIE
jgi:hypothetical protein